MAVQNLKAELHRARHDNSLEINDSEVIEETFATKQGESTGKGQEISEGNCGVFNFSKKPTNFSPLISALFSKKR